ncbi:MAG: protein phosphatase 2C domain-containing protein [Ruminococcus flavefaciens]|nr:protein phosphatase 2C domain-containing protein [Ruminococcus flavefaciens]
MWNIIKCAVQGRSHISNDIPCQDKTFSVEKNGVVATALADGAGSAKFSHYGAERVTAHVCNILTENFDDYYSNPDGVAVKKSLIEEIRCQLAELAEEHECGIRDLASTLLFTAVKDERYLLCHIGDGVLGYMRDGELKVASKPENGEFANTTIFTTSGNVIQSMKLIKGKLGSIDGFVLMSDGSEASLYSKRDSRLAPVLSRIMNFMVYMRSDLLENQLTESFNTIIRNATTDDCSIVISRNDHGRCYRNMDRAEKAEFLKLNINSETICRQIKSYDRIFEALETERTLKETAKICYIRPKFLKRKIRKLVELNFVEVRNQKYISTIKL